MIKGYKMLKATPVLDRTGGGESPAMSWGKIKGEPVYLGTTTSNNT